MIYKKITFSDFCDAFDYMDRKDNFSYDGKQALFDYLERISEDTGENIELDIIALCCEYTEYSSFEEFKENYNNIENFEDLNNHTTVIEIDNAMKADSFIIQNF